MNQSTNYEYDKIGRLVKVTDPLKGLSTKTYYDDGNVKTITDPNGNSSSFEYDKLGRLVNETTPIGSSKTYGYNAIGLLEKATNGRNQETSYIYDKAGRITSYIGLILRIFVIKLASYLFPISWTSGQLFS